jgi:hypothetical protein
MTQPDYVTILYTGGGRSAVGTVPRWTWSVVCTR